MDTPTPDWVRMNAQACRATGWGMHADQLNAIALAWDEDKARARLFKSERDAAEVQCERLCKRLEEAGDEMRKWESVYGKWPGGPALNMATPARDAPLDADREDVAQEDVNFMSTRPPCPNCGRLLLGWVTHSQTVCLACGHAWLLRLRLTEIDLAPNDTENADSHQVPGGQ